MNAKQLERGIPYKAREEIINKRIDELVSDILDDAQNTIDTLINEGVLDDDKL